jgi:uncharacterized protein (DUF1684 family)
MLKKKFSHFFYHATIAVAFLSCSKGPTKKTSTPDTKKFMVDATSWLKSVRNAWQKQDNEFKSSPSSPLSGAARFEIHASTPVYFIEKDGHLSQSAEKKGQAKFSVFPADGKWKWKRIAEEVACSRENRTVTSGSFLEDGDLFSAGKFFVEVYPLPDLLIALVFDSKSPLLAAFKTLKRFKPNRRFCVKAQLEKFKNPESVELVTARKKIKKRYKYAVAKFKIGTQKFELAVFQYRLNSEKPEPLFIPFTDKTTGKKSYGGGRYLIVKEPKEGDSITLDFNLATNPLCSYTSIYNCIVPPRENKLDIEILAGEKRYH